MYDDVTPDFVTATTGTKAVMAHHDIEVPEDWNEIRVCSVRSYFLYIDYILTY